MNAVVTVTIWTAVIFLLMLLAYRIYLMKLVKRPCLQTSLQSMFIIFFCGFFVLRQYKADQFDFFVFTQQWPQSVCIDINETKPDLGCTLPKVVNNWTIHGLWPSKITGEGPFYCNSSWPFVENRVEKIRSELEKHWPNMIGHTDPCSFWKHEWTKHGTCAANLPQLNSEYNYFSKCLGLRKTYDLTQIFANNEILPDKTKPYKVQQFRDALSYTRTRWRLQCVIKKDKTSQLIAQIEVCLSKQFEEVDCLKLLNKMPYNPEYEDCVDDIPVFYLPITPNAIE